MQWKEYSELSEKTLSSQFHCEKKEELLLHSVIGILTEMEELLDNHMGDSPDEINRSEEIADAWWYVAIIGREYKIDIPSTVDTSILDPMLVVLNIIKITLKLLDFLKKKLFYNKQINDELVKQYTSEIVALLLLYAKLYNIDTEKSWDINISKLRARYGDKFSSEKAINRNLVVERNILEGN